MCIAINKQRKVQQGQPFHLNRNQEHVQHLRVRVQSRKCQEHGEEDVGGTEADGQPEEEIHQETVQQRQEDAEQDEQIESGRSPVILQNIPYDIVEVNSYGA